MSRATYPYATGDLLVDPNTYFYSQFGGYPFIEAWMAARAITVAELPAPQEPPPPAHNTGPPDANGTVQGEHFLEYLYGQIETENRSDLGDETAFWLSRILKKFEVTKRLYRAYDENMKAVDRAHYMDLGLYVRFGEIVDVAYDVSGDTRFLNALLKCIDTLCAVRENLISPHKARLSWLIGRELDHIRRLAADVDVVI